MRPLLILIIVLASCTASSAQTLQGGNTPMALIVAEVVQKIVRPVIFRLPDEQRSILEEIEIKITTDEPLGGPQATITANGDKVILIPEGYLLLQDDYNRAVLLGSIYSDEYFSEHWLSHAVYRLSDNFDRRRGGQPLSPAEFFGLSETDTIDFEETHALLLINALTLTLIDIVFHEIAHFAIPNGVYDWTRTSSTDAREIEQLADDEATRFFQIYEKHFLAEEDFPDQGNLFGRVHSIGLSEEIASLKMSFGDPERFYPKVQARLRVPLALANCSDEGLSELCIYTNKLIHKSAMRRDFVKHYESRAHKGEKYALYRLALYFISGGRPAAGCSYIEQDDTLYGSWVTINEVIWAICLDAGYVWKDRPLGDRVAEATRLYCLSWRQGFETYNRYLFTVELLNWPNFCK